MSGAISSMMIASTDSWIMTIMEYLAYFLSIGVIPCGHAIERWKSVAEVDVVDGQTGIACYPSS